MNNYDLDRIYGKPLKNVYGPIGPHELRIICRPGEDSFRYATSIDIHSPYAQKIEEILHRMMSAKGGKISAIKRKDKNENN